MHYYKSGYAFSLLSLIILLNTGCSEADPALLQPGVFDYKKHLSTVTCETNSKKGETGKTNDVLYQNKIYYHLRAPENYDSQKGHPLLVVYAPAGRNGKATEKFTYLTRAATEAGFIIAYVDSQKMTLKTITALGNVPAHIAETWCVDQDNIFFTGHSDGGTISTALAFLEETNSIPKAIAPSAAGMSTKDLEVTECPEPLSVMVLHNNKDRLFPEFGAEAAKWWSQCNRCESDLKLSDIEGCMEYMTCAGKTRTLYCEAQGSHSHWPDLNDSMIKFFKASVH